MSDSEKNTFSDKDILVGHKLCAKDMEILIIAKCLQSKVSPISENVVI